MNFVMIHAPGAASIARTVDHVPEVQRATTVPRMPLRISNKDTSKFLSACLHILSQYMTRQAVQGYHSAVVASRICFFSDLFNSVTATVERRHLRTRLIIYRAFLGSIDLPTAI